MSLKELLTKPESRAVAVTLCGEGGMGKTSLAATFPSPVFIRAEDGMESLGPNAPMAFPIADSSQQVIDQLNMLGAEDHPYQTVVIDSVTKLNVLIEQEIVQADPKQPKSINQANGGYGAGLQAAAERHRQIKHLCDQLVRWKSMNVVFIAHADSELVELPDQDQYTRYTLRMGKRAVTHYSDDVDLVGFIKLKTFTRGDGDRKKAISDGTRIITCYPCASHVSKNRYGIFEDLAFKQGTNPLAQHVPALNQQQSQPVNEVAA
ncbi:MAG: ATP-binding protein [Pseudomonadota bacterium]